MIREAFELHWNPRDDTIDLNNRDLVYLIKSRQIKYYQRLIVIGHKAVYQQYLNRQLTATFYTPAAAQEINGRFDGLIYAWAEGYSVRHYSATVLDKLRFNAMVVEFGFTPIPLKFKQWNST